jgi:hypothetical protein
VRPCAANPIEFDGAEKPAKQAKRRAEAILHCAVTGYACAPLHPDGSLAARILV